MPQSLGTAHKMALAVHYKKFYLTSKNLGVAADGILIIRIWTDV